MGISPEIKERGRKRKAPSTAERWIKAAVAVVVGNALYYALISHLPPEARHRPFQLDFGVLVDFWFCLFFYGAVELALFLWRRRKRRT